MIDLRSAHAPIEEEIMEAISRVMACGEFSGGRFVSRFEDEFAAYCGSRYAVGVGSGTDALWLSLLAAGIKEGDEVITVPMTFVATVEAIMRAGAKPVFVDIDPGTYTMDPELLESAVSPRTKAIVPVHLFGRVANMEAIRSFASDHDLLVIEDAAQAHGAEYGGIKAGTIGDVGCFSFYPGKNLGAMGEAGAVVTSDAGIASRIRMLRDHGRSAGRHRALGWNCRMDGLQAAVLSVKLPHLDAWNLLRRSNAARYSAAFRSLPQVGLPEPHFDRENVHHVYPIRVGDRIGFLDHLHSKGVGAAIHYPVPVHLEEAFASLRHSRGSFPVSERCADQFVSLPVHPDLTECQIGTVIDTVCEAVAGAAAA